MGLTTSDIIRSLVRRGGEGSCAFKLGVTQISVISIATAAPACVSDSLGACISEAGADNDIAFVLLSTCKGRFEDEEGAIPFPLLLAFFISRPSRALRFGGSRVVQPSPVAAALDGCVSFSTFFAVALVSSFFLLPLLFLLRAGGGNGAELIDETTRSTGRGIEIE